MKPALALSVLSWITVYPTVVSAKDIAEGTLELSGNTNAVFDSTFRKSTYNTGEVKTSSQTDVGFSTRIGYSLTPQIAVGLVGSFDTYSQVDRGNMSSGDVTLKGSSIGVAPAVTMHFPLTPSLNAYASAHIGLASGEYSTNGKTSITRSGTYGGLNLGLANFVSDRIAINTFISYVHALHHWNYSNGAAYYYTYDNAGLNLGISFFLK